MGRSLLATALALGVGLSISWGFRPTAANHTASGTSRAAYVSLASIESKVDPALVDVVTSVDYGAGEAAGTGIVLTSSGEILTNNHVIDGATSIKVTDIGNGRTYTAAVVGYDESSDVAVLQLQGASGLRTANIGTSADVAAGDSVVALGNAGGVGGTPSAATGSVIALGQSISAYNDIAGTSEQLSGLIESDADVQAGDSGGPLVDADGQVVAMDTAASTGFQFQGSGANQAYSIPINEAVQIAKQIEGGRASDAVHVGATGFVGVQVSSDYQGSGVAVAGAVSGSPAAAVGLTAGDVITSLAGQSLGSESSLTAALVSYHPGDRVTIGWTDQAGVSHSATITLATGPAA